jgi:hypothetical protein
MSHRVSPAALLLALLVSSCDGGLSFEPYAVRRPLNLERVLGRQIVLVSARDTQALTIRYEPATRKNLITHTAKGDTLLHAWATKYRQLYYLTQELPNGQYLVHAAALKQDSVRGLTDGASQLRPLRSLVNQGYYAELLTYRSADSSEVRLRYDARVLRPFYAEMVPQYPAYRLFSAREFGAGAPALARSAAGAPAPLRVYPNPARGQVTVTSADSAARTVQLLDLRGRVLQTRRLAAATLTLPLDEVPAGVYVLRLLDGPGQTTATRRLVVE